MENLDEILQVFRWKIDRKITEDEFAHLHAEWLTTRKKEELSESKLYGKLKAIKNFGIFVPKLAGLCLAVNKPMDKEWNASCE